VRKKSLELTRPILALSICDILIGLLLSLISFRIIYQILFPEIPELKLGPDYPAPFFYAFFPGLAASILLVALGVSLLFKLSVSFHILKGYVVANILTLLSGAVLVFVEGTTLISDILFAVVLGIIIIAYTAWNIMMLTRQHSLRFRDFFTPAQYL